MPIFFDVSSNSSHRYPLQVADCDSNPRLVADKDDNGKYKLQRVVVMRSMYLQWACGYADSMISFIRI